MKCFKNIFKKKKKPEVNNTSQYKENNKNENKETTIYILNNSNDVEIIDVTVNTYSILSNTNVLPAEKKEILINNLGVYDISVYYKSTTLEQTISIEDSMNNYICCDITNNIGICNLIDANINENGVIYVRVLKGKC